MGTEILAQTSIKNYHINILHKENIPTMKTAVILLLVVVVWIALQAWILPRMGFNT